MSPVRDSPMIAAVLSCAYAGLEQIYNGQRKKGAIMALVRYLCWAAVFIFAVPASLAGEALVVLVWAVSLLLTVWAVLDTGRTAYHKGSGSGENTDEPGVCFCRPNLG